MQVGPSGASTRLETRLPVIDCTCLVATSVHGSVCAVVVAATLTVALVSVSVATAASVAAARDPPTPPVLTRRPGR